jgi:rhodanese-related sulfurtransferase
VGVPTPQNPETIEIEPSAVADWLAEEPTLQVIDVREPRLFARPATRHTP